MSDVSLHCLFGRLTDLAQRKLTTFYGEEDNATLQNLLHNVPNIVPRLTSLASDDNNMLDDDSISPLSTRAIELHHSKLQNISEEDSQEQGSPDAECATVQPDENGAYVNPIVAENPNPDNVRVASNWQSTNGRIGKQLVRQHSTVIEDDPETALSSSDAGSHGSEASPTKSPQTASVSLSSPEDDVDNSTLHTFLRMVSTRSMDATEESELQDVSNGRQSPLEVIHELIFLSCCTPCLKHITALACSIFDTHPPILLLSPN